MIREREVYKHRVHYYETDKMVVVHHSNYLRWFEEARTDILEKMGIECGKIEQEGILFPVLKVEANYRRMLYFGDMVSVKTYITKYNGIKVTIEYEVIDDKTGKLCNNGYSEHCFLNLEGKPVSLKKSYPQLDELFQKELEAYQNREE